MHVTLIILSALTFIFYGLLCLLTNHMRTEFQRYGLSQFRTLTGCLELAGGIGLLVGLTFTPLRTFAAGGLALLMLLGVGVRIKMKDPLLQAMPAFVLMLLNAFICYASF